MKRKSTVWCLNDDYGDDVPSPSLHQKRTGSERSETDGHVCAHGHDVWKASEALYDGGRAARYFLSSRR
jgi:hypothetical protein